MSYAWHDTLGNIGVGLIVLMYLMLQLRRIDSRSVVYSTLNAVGAGLIIVSLIYDFNASAMLIEVFWLLISLIGIFRHVFGPRNSPAGDAETS